VEKVQQGFSRKGKAKSAGAFSQRSLRLHVAEKVINF
jgi:hypothetical protein